MTDYLQSANGANRDSLRELIVFYRTGLDYSREGH